MSDFTSSFKNRLDDLQLVISNAQDELKRLRKVYTEFPDIQVNTDTLNQQRYFSKKINQVANEVQFSNVNGILIARPLFVFNGFNIYSNPLEFHVAFSSEDYYGYDFINNWQKSLSENDICVTVIEKIEAYRMAHLPDPYDDLSPERITEILLKRNE